MEDHHVPKMNSFWGITYIYGLQLTQTAEADKREISAKSKELVADADLREATVKNLNNNTP